MNIGIFTDQYYPFISGVVTSIKMLYEALEKLGHKVYIFTSLDEDDRFKNDPELNKNIINFKGRHYPFKACKDYKYTVFHKKFVKEVKKYNLDVIHLNTEFSVAKIGVLAAKELKIPLVYTMHTAWAEYIKVLFPKLDKIIHPILVRVMQILFTKPSYKPSVFTVLPTKKLIPVLKTYGIKSTEKIKIMPTGIDLSRFNRDLHTQQELDDLKKSLGLTNKFVFAYIGRTSKEKNIDMVISAFSKTFKGNDDVRLLIVGGGPVLEELKLVASDYEMLDKVIFTGLIPWEKVPMYYHISDVFVNASQSETQGLTYIEALASGLPNLVQKDLCIEGVIEDGYNGVIFDGEEDLINKYKYIFENKNLITEEIKQNAMNSSLKFSKEEFAKNALKIYEEAIEIKNKKLEKKNKR